MIQLNSICLIKRDLNPQGGLEKYTKRIIEGFLKRNFEVTLLTAQENLEILDVEVVTLPSSGSFSYQKIKSFDNSCKKYFETHSHPIVLGLDRTSYQTHIRAGNGIHRAFMDIRNDLDSKAKKLFAPVNPLNKIINSIEKQAIESPDLKLLMTNSNMVKSQALDYFDIDPKKIITIHNGVEHAQLKDVFENSLDNKFSIAKEYNLDPHKYNLLFVGHGYSRKGLLPLLHAISEVSFRDCHLIVVGKDKNIPSYERILEKLGVRDMVTFLGPVNDVKPLYQFADCAVIPSYYDPFANVTVEALAMGLFVISSKYNGGSEVLTDETGCVCDPFDSSSIADCIHHAMNQPKDYQQAQLIRSSVAHLDFSYQINEFIDKCISCLIT